MFLIKFRVNFNFVELGFRGWELWTLYGSWKLDWHLPMLSVAITSDKFFSDFQQVNSFVDDPDSSNYAIVCNNITRVRVMVFNATFNNISVISWRSLSSCLTFWDTGQCFSNFTLLIGGTMYFWVGRPKIHRPTY